MSTCLPSAFAEEGVHVPTVAVLLSICAAMGCQVSWRALKGLVYVSVTDHMRSMDDAGLHAAGAWQQLMAVTASCVCVCQQTVRSWF